MSTRTAGRSGGLRQANSDAVLDLLRDRRRTTRTELARLTGLSKATVSEIVNGFLQDGFAHEVGKHQAGRGRSRVVLEFNPDARLVLGAQLDDDACTVVLANLYGQPQATVVAPVRGGAPTDFIAATCAAVEALRPQAAAPIVGLGVGAPGSIDPRGRRVTAWVPEGWQDVPLAELLEARLDLPVLAANRAKVAALGEIWHGVGKGIANLVYVFVGNGIVAGIVIDGQLYFGSGGVAGELGHVTVEPNGQLCGCGNYGCLHTVASEPAILRLVRAKARHTDDLLATRLTRGTLGPVTLDLVLDAARQGDGVVLETLAEAGTYLGRAIANLVNLLNPQMVVIGGPLARLGDPFLGPIRREVRRRALWDSLAGLTLVPSALGDEAGAIGAAALLLESLASLPAQPASAPPETRRLAEDIA